MLCRYYVLLFSVFALQINSSQAGHHEHPSVAEHHATKGISVDAVWARATPGAVKNGAVYLTIKNDGHQPDELVKAHSDRAKRAALHTHIMKDGIARMRHVKAVAIPQMGKTAFKPGGFHIMLMGLKAPLKEGDTFTISLTFKNAGVRDVTVIIKKAGAMGAGEPMKQNMKQNMKHKMKH